MISKNKKRYKQASKKIFFSQKEEDSSKTPHAQNKQLHKLSLSLVVVVLTTTTTSRVCVLF